MNRISAKRKATTKLGYNSTFTAKDFRSVKPRSTKSERQQWKAKADKYFSEFIRLRDSDEHGMVTCVTCSHRGHWRTLQNGHWITRGHEATRYDEQNCNTQCRGCNYNGGQHLKHAEAIAKKHGYQTLANLELKAKIGMKPRHRRDAEAYKRIAEEYKAIVDSWRKTEPGKFRD